MSALLTRKLRFEPVAADHPAGEPIPVTIATDAPVQRGGMHEILDCSPSGADLSRAPLSLIVGHDASTLAVGLVENLKAEGSRVTGFARFSASTEAQQIRADVIAGIHAYVSVGYVVTDEGTAVNGGHKFRWRPHEVSIVSVPADTGAGFFRSLSGAHMTATTTTTPNNQQADDAEQIRELCKRHGLPDMVDAIRTRNLDLNGARTAVLEELARRDLESGGHYNTRASNQQGSPSEHERAAIVDTLVARMGGKPKGPTIGSIDCAGLATRALQLSGQRVRDGDTRDQILQRAMHTTSDFPQLLGTAAERVLHQAYQQAPAALKAVARMSMRPNFRPRSVIRMGDAPSLLKVNEHGEFKYGTVSESANAWGLETFGRILGLTRKAMVNDDLGGFADMLMKFGQAAARREADELVAALTEPAQVDGQALFAVARKTLIADELSLDGLGAAVLALRGQTDVGGGLVSQSPGSIVVPSALEMKALQLVATFAANQAANVQPFALNVVVEPRLDSLSAKAWYLVASNQTAFEYGYLEGQEGVQISQREGFEVDGLEIKARLDFGCGWVAPVGWVKANGAPL